MHQAWRCSEIPESHECGHVEESVVTMFLGLLMQICKQDIIVHCQIGLWKSRYWMHDSIREHKTYIMGEFLTYVAGSPPRQSNGLSCKHHFG